MIGDKIRQYRKLNHLSQEELAEQLGVSRQSISLWENNQTQPTIENVVVLSKLFRISTDELLTMDANESNSGVNEQVFTHDNHAEESTPQEILPIEEKQSQSQSEVTLGKKNKKKGNYLVISTVVILILALAVGALSASKLLKDTANETQPAEPVSLTAEDIYTNVLPSVVEIVATSSDAISTGTGFFYDEKGTVITNYHVIENCQNAEITMSNGLVCQVIAVLGYDTDRDIAILSTSCKLSEPIAIRTTPVKTGEKVYAIGSSLGLTGSLSDGIISATNRNIGGNEYIQTTAPISHGNSGGPLVDANGEVVGIVCAFLAEGQNLNLAIPIDAVDKIPRNHSIKLEKLFPVSKQEVVWISDWRFQYYADEDAYVLLFQLADKDKIPMAANGTVEIQIINDHNVSVYKKTHTFTASNFENWIYDETDQMYVASIYISPQSIAKGSTQFGTVHFKVYGDSFEFEECTEYAIDLPVGEYSPNVPKQEGSYNDNSPSVTESTEPPETQPQTQQYSCLDLWCENMVRNDGEYCAEHRCAMEGCPYSRESDSNYCLVCECSAVGCVNGKRGDSYYCTDHTCAMPGCSSEKTSGKDYCYYHSCFICNNPVNSGGSYCSEHGCAAEGCGSPKDTGSNYCYSHTP
jgi:transcriptional regulator with XRE-family HTH domain